MSARKAYNQKLGSFTQAYGSDQLDASLLLIPQVGFLPCDDPRVRGTIEAIEKHLMADGFVLRYRTETHGRRASAGRRSVSGVQLLDGERLEDAGPRRRCPHSCSSAC